MKNQLKTPRQDTSDRGILQVIIHEGLKPDSGTSKDARLIAASILSLNKTINTLIQMVLDADETHPTSKDMPSDERKTFPVAPKPPPVREIKTNGNPPYHSPPPPA